MIELAREYGITVARCVEGTALTGDALTDPFRVIGGQQELAVLRNILRAVGPSVPFALEAGLRYRTTTHGVWGLMLMTSRDVREALEAGSRYFDLTYSFNRPGFEVTSEEVLFFYGDCDNPDDLRAALVERDLGALVTLQRELLEGELPVRSVSLRGPRPAYAAAFEPLFGVTPQWNASDNVVSLDIAWLDASGPFADGFARRLCEEQCRTLLDRWGLRTGVAGLVRARILQRSGEFPNMETVASELGMTSRTLRNRLRSESTSYREIVETTREALAEELLSAPTLTVAEIAERLGYADASTFIAAFKRWKGVPPRAYKGRHAKSSQKPESTTTELTTPGSTEPQATSGARKECAAPRG